MTTDTMVLTIDPPAERVLGMLEGSRPGPLFFVLGGIHGNEPAGVLAARRVLAGLERSGAPLCGRFVALAGNLAGLAKDARYLDEDLNRLWSKELIDKLRAQDPKLDSVEQAEMRELLSVVSSHLREGPWEKVVVLDLHSTSADGSPFSIMADTIQNRRVAFALPIPVLLGLEETLEGTVLSYVSEMGHVAFCLEGGQNELESTIEHHEVSLWLTLIAAGSLDAADAPPDLAERRRAMAETAWSLPSVVEVAYREAITPGDQFEMIAGFNNFDLIEEGQDIARSGPEGETPVQAPLDGIILMPLYQGQGDDGFFVGHEVRPIWLKLSAILRRLHLQCLLPFLPGVRRHPKEAQVLLVDTHTARWLPLQIFHLFGYRHARDHGALMVFVRRPDRFR
ncbi:MAG: putative deacylase [Planctomycetota bacterium]|jgi:predicted deacylase